MSRKHQKTLKAKLSADHPFFDIIEDAYTTFDYPTPSSTDVCQYCCMDARVESDFFNPPVRDLPAHYVQDWYFAAYDPVAGVSKATWAYLLPRILEMLADETEDPANVGLEVSLNRFQTGNRENWSEKEWDVLDRFQRAYLSRAVNSNEEYLDDTICMFALAGWPLKGLFSQVAAHSDEALVIRFYHDWCIGGPDIWITAFWEASGNSEAFEFYTSRALHTRMEALAFNDATDPALAEKALAVAGVIEANADWAQK